MVVNTTLVAGRDGAVEKIDNDGRVRLWAYNRREDREAYFSLAKKEEAYRFAGIQDHERGASA